jgi:hypothetical protein
LALREAEVAQLAFGVQLSQVDMKGIVQHTQLHYASCHTTKISSLDLGTFYCCRDGQYTVYDELHQEFPFSTQLYCE